MTTLQLPCFAALALRTIKLGTTVGTSLTIVVCTAIMAVVYTPITRAGDLTVTGVAKDAAGKALGFEAVTVIVNNNVKFKGDGATDANGNYSVVVPKAPNGNDTVDVYVKTATETRKDLPNGDREFILKGDKGHSTTTATVTDNGGAATADVRGRPFDGAIIHVAKNAQFDLNCLKMDPTFTFSSATRTLSFSNAFDPSNPNIYVLGLADYSNRPTTMTNGPGETIFGTQVILSPLTLLSGVNGIYQFSDGNIQIIDSNGNILLSADLTDVTADTTASLPAMQGFLTDVSLGTGLGSSMVDNWANDVAVGGGIGLFLDSNFVQATNGFTQDASVSGFLDLSSSVPEPSSFVLISIGGLLVYCWRRTAACAVPGRTSYPAGS